MGWFNHQPGKVGHKEITITPRQPLQGSVEFLRSEKLTPPRSILGSDGEVRPGVQQQHLGGVGWW